MMALRGLPAALVPLFLYSLGVPSFVAATHGPMVALGALLALWLAVLVPGCVLHRRARSTLPFCGELPHALLSKTHPLHCAYVLSLAPGYFLAPLAFADVAIIGGCYAASALLLLVSFFFGR